LKHELGQSYRLFLIPRINPKTGKNFELAYNELFLNPYTGEPTGRRVWGDVSLVKENIMPFVYRLHYALALPEHMATFGVYLLGIAALFWFLDSFTGFYLTVPPGKKRAFQSKPPVPACSRRFTEFWPRWKLAWQIKYSRFIYDLHRAGGLWLWSMLIILAWSGVAFNLKEVYQPVMSTVLNMRDVLPKPMAPIETPGLDWRAARQQGRQHIGEAARRHGFTVEHEQSLALDREHGVYHYRVKSNRDLGKYGATVAILDANTGELKSLTTPDTDSLGDVIHRWITWLHTARVFGLPMQISISIMGLVVTMLSMSGLTIWLRKRNARKKHARKQLTLRN
jgi:uncharacterized iron-regulated membrane protein